MVNTVYTIFLDDSVHILFCITFIDIIKDYFHSGREYKLILKRLKEVHGIKKRSVNL